MYREKWGIANRGEALSSHCSVKTKSPAEQTKLAVLAKDRCISPVNCTCYRKFHAVNQISLYSCGMCLITHLLSNKRCFQDNCTFTSFPFQIVCNNLVFKFDFLSHNKRSDMVLCKIFNRDGFDNFMSLINVSGHIVYLEIITFSSVTLHKN